MNGKSVLRGENHAFLVSADCPSKMLGGKERGWAETWQEGPFLLQVERLKKNAKVQRRHIHFSLTGGQKARSAEPEDEGERGRRGSSFTCLQHDGGQEAEVAGRPGEARESWG